MEKIYFLKNREGRIIFLDTIEDPFTFNTEKEAIEYVSIYKKDVDIVCTDYHSYYNCLLNLREIAQRSYINYINTELAKWIKENLI